jgi:hypothetical protein
MDCAFPPQHGEDPTDFRPENAFCLGPRGKTAQAMFLMLPKSAPPKPRCIKTPDERNGEPIAPRAPRHRGDGAGQKLGSPHWTQKFTFPRPKW